MDINTSLAITPDTKIGDMLNTYPHLQDVLIEIAPVFSKLKNPVLRKTIAKMTSIRQAASVGNIQLSVMINTLRRSAGQEESFLDNSERTDQNNNEAKENSKGRVVEQYDAREDLQAGAHPVGKVLGSLSKLKNDERYLLITPFMPAPLIDKANERGFQTETKKVSDSMYETYFWLKE
ncbi:MAG: DUF1858 domain-containing protein [Bacillota bacterium]